TKTPLGRLNWPSPSPRSPRVRRVSPVSPSYTTRRSVDLAVANTQVRPSAWVQLATESMLSSGVIALLNASGMTGTSARAGWVLVAWAAPAPAALVAAPVVGVPASEAGAASPPQAPSMSARAAARGRREKREVMYRPRFGVWGVRGVDPRVRGDDGCGRGGSPLARG